MNDKKKRVEQKLAPLECAEQKGERRRQALRLRRWEQTATEKAPVCFSGRTFCARSLSEIALSTDRESAISGFRVQLKPSRARQPRGTKKRREL